MSSLNGPNLITAGRFVLAGGVFVAMAWQCWLTAMWCFILAAVSDYFDGWLARTRNLETEFGKMADPLADKVLILGTLVMLLDPMHQIDLSGIGAGPSLTANMVVLMLLRELLISGIRGMAASQGISFPANIWGKVKAVCQFIVIPAFLLNLALRADDGIAFGFWLDATLHWCARIMVAFTLISAIPYLVQARRQWTPEV